MRLDKVTQHTDVLSFFNQSSRSGRNRRKEKALTRGGLRLGSAFLYTEKSAFD